MFSYFRRELLPGILIGIAALFLSFLALEAWYRLTAPFGSIAWPVRFDASFGHTFKPGAEVRWTNHLDFWQIQRANRYGFLDREPVPVESRRDACHVAIIGDSFVEAAQVPIEKKFQVVIEALAREGASAVPITASAFGYSGTGQLNQLPFYDLYAREQKPRIVVLVFVYNDFVNNSAILEALRFGWDPDHAPRLFAKRAGSGAFELVPAAPNWKDYRLEPPSVTRDLRASAHAKLQKHSAFYRWLFVKIRLLYPRAAAVMSGQQPAASLTAHYARLLQKRPGYGWILEGWDPENYPGMDESFLDESLAPVFAEAVEATGFALDQFLERASRDRFHLVILAAQPEKSRRFDRLGLLAEARGVPVIDLRNHIDQQGGTPADARFAHDGHWSEQGHLWAAGATMDYIKQHPEVCARDD